MERVKDRCTGLHLVSGCNVFHVFCIKIVWALALIWSLCLCPFVTFSVYPISVGFDFHIWNYLQTQVAHR